MGSWANSIHVLHNDPTALAAAVKNLFLAKGYAVEVGVSQAAPGQHAPGQAAAGADQGTKPAPPKRRNVADDDIDWEDDDAAFEASLEDDDEDDPDSAAFDGDAEPRERQIVLHQPVQGWIGILDSAGLLSDLAQDLSRQLHTDAVLLYVNDSDSWGYELYRHGQSLDRFDSSGLGDMDDGSISPEWQRAMDNEDEEELERLLLKNAPQGPIVFPDGRMAPPPEMAMLLGKMAAGRATLGDRLRYAWLWLKFQCRRLLGWLVPGTAQFGFDVPQSQPLDAASLAAHLQALAGIFPQGNAAALKKLLPQSRFPAEDLLKEFLVAVGLPGVYAYLSYDYRVDFGPDELAEEGVVATTELRFVKDANL